MLCEDAVPHRYNAVAVIDTEATGVEEAVVGGPIRIQVGEVAQLGRYIEVLIDQ